MKKIPIVLSVFLLGSLSWAQGSDHSKVQITVSRVSGSVYLLRGEGGNIAASIGDDGIVMVDDEYADLAEKIQAALNTLTDKPIRFVINTHYHIDHVGANPYFQKLAPVIAHENVRKRLSEPGLLGNGGSIKFPIKPLPANELPMITFEHEVTLHMNGEDIHVIHVRNGHTDGDSIVYFPKSNVVHMGDDFLRIGFPFVDLDSGGNVLGWIGALEEVIARLPPNVKVIPGHGPVSNLDDVREFIKMMKDTRGAVARGVQQGKSLDQLKRERVLEPWSNWSGEWITSDLYLETLYNDLFRGAETFAHRP
jgi:cyclase